MGVIRFKVNITIREKTATSPEVQVQKFKETIAAGSGELVESVESVADGESPLVRTTVWQRSFQAGKKPQQMIRTIRNLLQRAGEYSDIRSLEAEIAVEGHPPETFSWGSFQSSDYFREKSWK